jgi:NodT family efflux transporter outer membrane factor (OMF) lipoprotein
VIAVPRRWSCSSLGAALRTAMTVAAVSALAACRVGPDYHAPSPPPGAEASLASLNPKLESAAEPPDAWWRLYSDGRLDELVQEALRANRDLAAADANFAAARAALSGVRAARYPSTEVAAQGLYGRDPITEEILEIGGHAPQNIWVLEDIFQVAYEVDLFGRVRRSLEAAKANADSLAATRDGVRVLVAASTTRAYASICSLGEELDVAHHSVQVVRQEANISEQRYQAGGGSRFELERAQALVAEVGAAIPQLEGERQAALFELTALLGRAPAQTPTDVESCTKPPTLSGLIPVGDGQALIRRRPDVRVAERRLAAATAEIGVVTAELYPSVHLVGFYGGAGSELSVLGTNAGLAWGAGPSISWNFPNQSGARARVRQAKAYQAAALAAFDSVVLTALKETERALTSYGAALEQRQALVEAQQRIHRSFEIVRDGYAAGSSSYLDVLTTEQTLISLDAQVASSDAQLLQLQIDLFKALGGGWSQDASQERPAAKAPNHP